MKKNIILGLCFVVLVAVLLFIHPYNLYHHMKADQLVTDVFNNPAINEKVFMDDSEITKVQYLGSNMYRLETVNNNYVIEIKTEGNIRSYKVYEFNEKLEAIGD